MVQQQLKDQILKIWNDPNNPSTIFDSIKACLRAVSPREDKYQAYHDVAETWEAAERESARFPFDIPGIPFPLAWLSILAQIHEESPLTPKELQVHKEVFKVLDWYTPYWSRSFDDNLRINEKAAKEYFRELCEKSVKAPESKTPSKVINIPFVTNTSIKS